MTELAFRLLCASLTAYSASHLRFFIAIFSSPYFFSGIICVVDRNQFQRNSFRKFSNTWLNNDRWRQSHYLLFDLRERCGVIETNFTISCFLSFLFPGLTKSCSKLRYFFFFFNVDAKPSSSFLDQYV